MNSLCHAVMRHFSENSPLALATIVGHNGSAPRTAGARMLVLPGGSILGSVGGGRCEAETVAAALALLREHEAALPAHEAALPGGASQPGALLEFSLRGITDMDMICGGELTVLLELLPDETAVRAVFAAACAAENAGEPFTFATRVTPCGGVPAGATASPRGAADNAKEGAGNARAFVPDAGNAGGGGTGPGVLFRDAVAALSAVRRCTPVRVRRCVLLPGTAGVTLGAAFPPPDVRPLAEGFAESAPRLLPHGNGQYLLEHFPRSRRLFIFGGGHVSRALARLAAGLGFAVTVLDDRPEFTGPGRFPGCAARLLPSLGREDVERFFARANPNPCDAVVIVTRGHAHDRDVLAAALGANAGYLGMIGSKSKRAAVYGSLARSGFTEADFSRVRSPIGLSIGAETPEEIAVSIAAELIQWRKGE